jgi:Putative prokaryotic signal transducing protein
VAEGFVRVLLTQSWVEAEIVRGRLEAEGIPVDLKGDREAPYPVGPAEVLVPASHEAQARSVLDRIKSGAYELPDEDESDRSTPPEDAR